MVRIISIIGTALAVLGLSGCSSDLDVTAPYKNITIVYAFLSTTNADGTPADTQWVKINKAFLGEGNAFTYAQVADSNEYTDAQLQAEVQALNAQGTVTASYPLQSKQVGDRDPGLFNGPQHKLYYFTATLDPSKQYRLHAIAKGQEITATTPIVGDLSPAAPLLSSTFVFNFATSTGTYGSPQVRWTSGPNSKRYELSYRFNYDEVHVAGDTAHLSFTQFVGTTITSGTNGNEEGRQDISGESFFQSIAAHVHPDANVVKRIFRGIDVIWAVASPDLNTYLQLASPISGIVEERPQYTNVQNGYGLFSSRYFRELRNKAIGDGSKHELVEGRYTAGLGFCFPGSSPPLGCD
ncbi:MAG: DUF4249 family protein [Flavobacteriales bacterium]